MYQYLYLVDILSSLNSTLNIITVFTFFSSILLFFIHVFADDYNITNIVAYYIIPRYIQEN